MSPEFSAILAEREQLGAFFKVWPLFLWILASALAFKVARKWLAFVFIVMLAALAISIPIISMGAWWFSLEGAAVTEEDQLWLLNHDGGGLLVAPISLIFFVAVFWIVPLFTLVVQMLPGLARKRKQKSSA
jgi:hypothetical protein